MSKLKFQNVVNSNKNANQNIVRLNENANYQDNDLEYFELHYLFLACSSISFKYFPNIRI